MSGDVQPRKRKDKKRKKDELGIEEPRGTAAVFGEGDVFMHSQHDHGTGGHWCAKVIFFSLLAILVTLIGLIILENRGLSELEANAVESRYSGVLEGWLEDAPDDDHHDEHTLELNHHDDDDDGHDEHVGDGDQRDEVDDEHYPNDEDEHSDEDDEQINEDNYHLEDDDDEANDDDDDNAQSIEDDDDNAQSIEDDEDADNDDDAENDDGADNDEDQLDNDDSQEQDLENNEDEVDDDDKGYQMDEADENDDDLQNVDETDIDDDSSSYDEAGDHEYINSNEIDKNESEENQNEDNEEDEEHDEDEEEDQEVEVEKLEKEASEEDLEPVSTELPALPEEEDDDDNKDEGQSDEKEPEEDEDSGIEDEAEEFLEVDDADEPPVEKITVPAGKPFVEVEEEVSSEQPPDTLEEEEEYEKRQEELRREEAQASHMWLKLGVGGALLVATHAVMRRATHSRDTQEREEHASREETPLIDRRLTLIPEEAPIPVRRGEEISRPVIERQVLEKVAPVVKSVPIQKQESEEDEDEPQPSEDEEEIVIEKSTKDKELYSEEEGDEEAEEEEEPEVVQIKKEIPKQAPVVAKTPQPEPEPEDERDDEDPEDVEIIGDEQLEEELEEEGDEEEISDVDDAELLSRLEAKYGKLPEPERPGQKHKDGGNSIEDVWPGEPADAYWRQQLDSAEQELRQGEWSAAGARAGATELRGSARARFVAARALDLAAEARRDNALLSRAIAAYLDLLKIHEHLSDKKLLEVAQRALDRIQFRGTYLSAEPVYKLLIRRFPNEPGYRNNLTISFLMANRVDLAEDSLKETLQRWPNDRVALAHHGFVLKTMHKKYEEAAEAFKKALEGDTGPANEARFYYHYGDSLLLLGRPEEAHAIHERGARLGHFLSPSQRSLYNVNRLRSTPWWDVERTPYAGLARALERSWREILKEGEAAREAFEQEKEGLRERGEWSQLDLFVRGQEVAARCGRAPATCAAVRAEPAAARCRRGQVKFSVMAPGTHVRAHVGPTNCRLRMHLALSNTKDTFIRVDKEIRQWEVGKVLMFDDSFEHEVWHNGTGARLVLIVDVWHPDLTERERRQLPAI